MADKNKEVKIVNNRFLGDSIGILDKNRDEICCGCEIKGKRHVRDNFMGHGGTRVIEFEGTVIYEDQYAQFIVKTEEGFFGFKEGNIIHASLEVIGKSF